MWEIQRKIRVDQLPLWRYRTLHAGLTTIIVRRLASNLKKRTNVCNRYKPANIRAMARFVAQLAHVSTPTQLRRYHAVLVLQMSLSVEYGNWISGLHFTKFSDAR